MGNQQGLVCGKYVGEEKPGETRALRNALLPDGADLVKDYKGMDNLKQIFEANVKSNPTKPFLGTRAHKINEKGEVEFGEYNWKNYGQVHEESNALAKFLIDKELCPKVDTEHGPFRFISLYSKNREEWVTTDFAGILSGITVVTLYDTLGKDSIEYILDQTYIKTVVCQADKVKNIVNLKKEGKIKGVTHIIYFDEIKHIEIDEIEASTLGISVIRFENAIAEGKKVEEVKFDEVTADTYYTFSYTSGTTGMPKGVMITHRNFVSNIAAITQFDPIFTIRDDDVYISYLPLAHVIERMLLLISMTYQMQMGFFQGDVFKLKDDLAVLRPTIMASVPRLYNRFYDLMQQKINEQTGMKRRLIDTAVRTKLANLEASAQTTHMLYDPLVFNKFKAILGGRVRVMVSGSAPIAKDVLSFLKIAFCCQIHEAYGQTECAAPATATWSKDPTVGHVGAPYPPLELKLVDVPEMKYTSKDVDENGVPMPRGEVCYRGYSAFKGYFRQPEQTRETIDQDGWVHTGDIGLFQPNGTLKIIDRKKNIFKLSQGEYIAPDKVEGKITQSLYIAQVFVYGDSLQHTLVAIVVPEKPMLEKWAAENQIPGDYEQIIANEKTNAFLFNEIKTKCKEAGFFGFEIPTKIHVTSTQFTIENDLFTPTFKLKRNEAKQYFLTEIKRMYDGAKLQGEE